MKIDPVNFTVRLFESTDFDYSAMVKLFNQDWPKNQSTVEFWKQQDSQHNSKYLNQRYILEIETKNSKQIVALGFINKRSVSNEPGKYFIKIHIVKEFKDQGLGEPLYTHMVTDLADKNPVVLKTEIREDHVSLIELFQQKGFQETKTLF